MNHPHSYLQQILSNLREKTVEKTVEKENISSNCSRKEQPNLGNPLIEPSIGVSNHGNDNAEHNLIVRENELLGNRYRAIKRLGRGVYGFVIQAIDTKFSESTEKHDFRTNRKEHYVAIKIIKNQGLFHKQASEEIRILKDLNRRFERNGVTFNIVQFQGRFVWKKHICLVFECLGKNLFELIRWRGYHGLPLPYVSSISKQLLKCLVALEKRSILHCDLKPENILLKNNDAFEPSWTAEEEKDWIKDEEYIEKNIRKYSVKVIDFGSASYEEDMNSFYVQSRFYRAPEALLGIEYDSSIDMWSFACVIAELYLGIPLFSGRTSYDQVKKIVRILGPPPRRVFRQGRYSKRYFSTVEKKKDSTILTTSYEMKTEEEYCDYTGDEVKGGITHFNTNNLESIILKKEESLKYLTTPTEEKLSDDQETLNIWKKKNENRKEALLDFLRGILVWDSSKRLTPKQALNHPFITGEEFTTHRKFGVSQLPIRAYSKFFSPLDPPFCISNVEKKKKEMKKNRYFVCYDEFSNESEEEGEEDSDEEEAKQETDYNDNKLWLETSVKHAKIDRKS